VKRDERKPIRGIDLIAAMRERGIEIDSSLDYLHALLKAIKTARKVSF
jgi:hypothetical protein